MRRINEAGLALIKQFEGCKLEAYRDMVGVVTIGYGHTGSDIAMGDVITQEGADTLLQTDLEKFEKGVEDLVQVDISDNQFAALVCFSYNLGLASFGKSTLLKEINAGDLDCAADEFVKWDRAGGHEVPGLLRRRQAERNLFISDNS